MTSVKEKIEDSTELKMAWVTLTKTYPANLDEDQFMKHLRSILLQAKADRELIAKLKADRKI